MPDGQHEAQGDEVGRVAPGRVRALGQATKSRAKHEAQGHARRQCPQATDGATEGKLEQKRILTEGLMRKPREKTAKKGGYRFRTCNIEKDGKRRKNAARALTKVLRTRGTGGVGFPSHLTTYLPLYSPVSSFGGLVRSTGGVEQAEKNRDSCFC